MTRPQIEGAVFEVGQCFVECGIAFDRDLEPLLERHARAEVEPNTLVQIWGDRIASFWPDGDNLIVVETIVFSAPGWQRPLTHVEVISAEKRRAFEPLFERDEFPPALEWPEPRFLRARADREDNITVLHSMNHSLLAGNKRIGEPHP
jgi:hypothetical protein